MPKDSTNPATAAVARVSAARFAERLAAGARAFDTRPLTRYQRDALPGVDHFSLEMAQAGDFPTVPRDEPVYLICERGGISELVGLYLKEAGFLEVYNVEGGMIAWRRLKETS